MASRTLPKDILDHKMARAKGILGELSPDSPNNDWMSLIEDQTPLSRISIPGTHDAAAWNYAGPFHEFWNCQSVPLLKQLELGIRALDLRFGWAKDNTDRLLFYHSVACLDEHAQLEDVFWGLFNWLNKHPTETLVISLKRDDFPNDHDADIQQKIVELMSDDLTQDYWFQTPNSIPTLGAVRGKIVLLNRMIFNNLESGIDLSTKWVPNGRDFSIPFSKSQAANVEDYFLMKGHPRDAKYQIDDKEQATLTHLAKAKEGKAGQEEKADQLWITFSSAVGDRHGDPSENVTPKVMATGREGITGINKRLIKWCKEQGGLEAGIIFMDFIASDEELIDCFLPKKSSSSNADSRR